MNPNDMIPGQIPPVQPGVPAAPIQQPVAGQYQTAPLQVSGGAPAPHSVQSPYEFITNPNTQAKKPLVGGQSPAKRILLALVGVGALVAIIAVVLTFLLPKNTSVESLTSLAQQQQEMIRVASLGERQASSEAVKGFAFNVELSLGTNQSQLLSYIDSKGKALTVNQLSLSKDADTDKLLAAAQATSTYDSALKKVLASQLQTYLSDVQKTFKETSSKKLKTILQSSYAAGKTLLDQAQSDQ